VKPLAFIIITYNRPADLLALVRNIAQLDEADRLLQDVVIVNNASTEDYSEAEAAIRQYPHIPFRYIRSEENLGVARGRNFALRYSQAPYLIMLDDDAEMGNRDCLIQLLDEFNRQQSGRRTAIISFKVLYFETREMQKNALPHKNYAAYKDKSFFETYFFAGGAHAIRREVLDAVGHYPEDFFYGMEEYDLSYRILDKGYGITYSNRIVMLHKESPLGRKPKKEKVRMMWVNKSKVAWRYLPEKYYWSTLILWGFFYLRETGFDLKGWFLGLQEAAKIRHSEARRPIADKTLQYLQTLHARLFY